MFLTHKRNERNQRNELNGRYRREKWKLKIQIEIEIIPHMPQSHVQYLNIFYFLLWSLCKKFLVTNISRRIGVTFMDTFMWVFTSHCIVIMCELLLLLLLFDYTYRQHLLGCNIWLYARGYIGLFQYPYKLWKPIVNRIFE